MEWITIESNEIYLYSIILIYFLIYWKYKHIYLISSVFILIIIIILSTKTFEGTSTIKLTDIVSLQNESTEFILGTDDISSTYYVNYKTDKGSILFDSISVNEITIKKDDKQTAALYANVYIRYTEILGGLFSKKQEKYEKFLVVPSNTIIKSVLNK